MSEEEAHRYMQKCSMDSGNNMVETAKMIFALMKYSNCRQAGQERMANR